MTSTNQLSQPLQQQINQMLTPGETVLWIDQPDPAWWLKTPWIWGVCAMVSLVGCVLAVLIVQHIQTIEQWKMFNELPTIMVRIWLAMMCFNLICCWLFPLTFAWMDKRSAYVITDQHVMRLIGYFPFNFKMKMRFDQITTMKIKTRAKGLASINLYGQGSLTAIVPLPVKPSKFKPTICIRHLKNAPEVEALIHEQMIDCD